MPMGQQAHSMYINTVYICRTILAKVVHTTVAMMHTLITYWPLLIPSEGSGFTLVCECSTP